MTLELIIGIAACCIVLLYLAFSWDKKEHWLLQLFTCIFVVFLLTLVPKAGLDNKDTCEIVLANETVNGNFTSYDYMNHCESNAYTTHTTFFKSISFFTKVFIAYLFVYFNYVLWIKKRLDNWSKVRKKKGIK